MFKSWEEMSELEQLQSIYSDASKDAYGFRDRSMTTEQWNSVEWLKSQLAYLERIIEEQLSEEEAATKRAVADFESRIVAIIKVGAGDRETAVRWILDQYDATDDPDFVCYKLGLPYGYFNAKVAA